MEEGGGEMKRTPEQEWLFEQFKQLAADHKAVCPGAECTVALYTLWRVLKMLSVPVAQEELRYFG
jgi:hypothetical protein